MDGGGRTGLTRSSEPMTSANSASAHPYTHTAPAPDDDSPSAYSTPPTAGPAIIASWNSVALNAAARGNSDVGTRLTTIACPVGIQNARPAPTSPIARNTGQVSRLPESVNASSTSTATTSVA